MLGIFVYAAFFVASLLASPEKFEVHAPALAVRFGSSPGSKTVKTLSQRIHAIREWHNTLGTRHFNEEPSKAVSISRALGNKYLRRGKKGAKYVVIEVSSDNQCSNPVVRVGLLANKCMLSTLNDRVVSSMLRVSGGDGGNPLKIKEKFYEGTECQGDKIESSTEYGDVGQCTDGITLLFERGYPADLDGFSWTLHTNECSCMTETYPWEYYFEYANVCIPDGDTGSYMMLVDTCAATGEFNSTAPAKSASRIRIDAIVFCVLMATTFVYNPVLWKRFSCRPFLQVRPRSIISRHQTAPERQV